VGLKEAAAPGPPVLLRLLQGRGRRVPSPSSRGRCCCDRVGVPTAMTVLVEMRRKPKVYELQDARSSYSGAGTRAAAAALCTTGARCSCRCVAAEKQYVFKLFSGSGGVR
jgi:hypothetical protein